MLLFEKERKKFENPTPRLMPSLAYGKRYRLPIVVIGLRKTNYIVKGKRDVVESQKKGVWHHGDENPDESAQDSATTKLK